MDRSEKAESDETCDQGRPTLEDLLDEVTPENLHGEVETGPAQGREIL
jgi:antitoxin component of MazEF toxin-antitoxin module